MFLFGRKKEATTGNVKFEGLKIGTPLTHRGSGSSDKIIEVVRGGFRLKNAGGPFSKSYIFKNFQLN